MRLLIKLILALVALIIIAIIAIPFFVDPNDLKPQISEQVQKMTGRDLIIEGDIGLSVFPWVALDLGKVSLSNAEGFRADTFAQVEAAHIRVKLMPLLSKEVEMDTVTLDGLVLNLETNKDGKTNWDSLTGAPKAEEEPADSKFDLASVQVSGINLSNANIHWRDDRTGDNYRLDKLNLATGSVVLGKPVAVSTDFNIISAKPNLNAHIELNADLIADPKSNRYQLKDIKFNTTASSTNLPFDAAYISLVGDIDANLAANKVSVSGLTLTSKTNQGKQVVNAIIKAAINADLGAQQVTVSGLNVTADITDPNAIGGTAHVVISSEVSAYLSSQIIQLAGLKVNVNAAGTKIPNDKMTATLRSDVTVDLTNQTLNLPNFTLNAEELDLAGKVAGNNILSDNANFRGMLKLVPVNPRELAAKFGISLPPMADATTLKAAMLAVQFDASANHFNASKLNLTLDQTKISGQVGITNFSSPAYTFKLAVDVIDLDRYLPPATDATATSAATTPASELPLATLRALKAKGTLDIGKLRMSGITSQKVHVTIGAADGLVSLSPMRAQLYQGSYQGNVKLDARGNALTISVNEKLSGVQAEPLLKDLSDSDRISGSVNVAVKLTGTGLTTDQIKQSLAGNGSFSFTDGALKGINIAHAIRKAKAALTGETIANTGDVKTDFSSLGGSFTANQGVINNPDFKLLSPLLRVDGKGTANLGTEALDYGVKVAIVGSIEGQDAKDLEDLKGLIIPIKITGTFSEPKPRVDLAKLLEGQAVEKAKAALAEKLNIDALKAKAEAKLKAQTEALREKATEKLGDKLGDLVGGQLGGLLGGETQPAEGAAPTEKPQSLEDKAKEALADKLGSFF